MRFRDRLNDLAAWAWPSRFIAGDTVVRPMPTTPEEIEKAKREFLEENPPSGPGWKAYAVSDDIRRDS